MFTRLRLAAPLGISWLLLPTIAQGQALAPPPQGGPQVTAPPAAPTSKAAIEPSGPAIERVRRLPDFVPNAFWTDVDENPDEKARCMGRGGFAGTAIMTVLSEVPTKLPPLDAQQDPKIKIAPVLSIPSAPTKTLCAYTWNGNPDAVPPHGPGGTAVKDYPAISVHAAPGASEWAKFRNAMTHARTGALRTKQQRAAYTARGKVRVAVIDAVKVEPGKAPVLSQHALDVRNTIGEVTCEMSNLCGVDFKFYAGIPLGTFGDTIHDESGENGSYATKGQLARQIDQAVEDWRKEAPHLPMVINLSLGWSGCWNPKPPNAEEGKQQEPRYDPTEHDLVWHAIYKASCSGALVVAAAGNEDAVQGCPPGSLRELATPFEAARLHSFPARWANLSRRPEREQCAQYQVSTDPNKTGPVVLAVGAVDERDAKLGLSAQDATLVAFGNATAFKGSDHVFSGTSASTALVSGIAAALWVAKPELSTAEVERALIVSAPHLRHKQFGGPFVCNLTPGLPEETTPAPASGPAAGAGLLHPCADLRCSSVRRASLCRALAHVPGLPEIRCGPAANQPSTSITWPELSYDGSAARVRACASDSTETECKPPSGFDGIETPWQHTAEHGPGKSCGTCAVKRRNTPRQLQAEFNAEVVKEPGVFANYKIELGGGEQYPLFSGGTPSSQQVQNSLCDVTGEPTGKLYYTEDVGPGVETTLVNWVDDIVVQTNDPAADDTTDCTNE